MHGRTALLRMNAIVLFAAALAILSGCDENSVRTTSEPETTKQSVHDPSSADANSPNDARRYKLDLRSATEKTPAAVVVQGLNATEAAALAEALDKGELDDDRLHQILRVEVESDALGSKPPVLGEYSVEGTSLVFEPRYPFRGGLAYRAWCHPSEIPGSTIDSPIEGTFAFAFPTPRSAEPTTVAAVYPTGHSLPENQLKFYVHFSAPMSRGEAYKQCFIVDADGRAVDLPFLEIGEELWDSSGTRLTLLFDPGRIKRGLKPREEEGPILEAGKSYAFVINAEWPDANGRPLASGFRKEFSVTAPDDVQPSLDNWSFDLPQAGTTDALTIHFPEPLDQAMLERVLNIVDPSGKPVAGAIAIDNEETRWVFEPEQTWQAGEHQLLVDAALEDRAGNSLAHPFEVDRLKPVEREVQTQTVVRKFEIPPAATIECSLPRVRLRALVSCWLRLIYHQVTKTRSCVGY